MKQKISLLLLMSFISLSAFATGEIHFDPASGLTFKVIADFPLLNDYQVEVTAGEEKYEGDIVIPSKVTIEDIDYSVTRIGEWAFKNCDNLTSVTIPKGVTSIGQSAFGSCSINSLELPEGITEINDYAFWGCKFTSISMPNTLKTIGKSVFRESKLKNVVIPNSVTSMGNEAFRQSSVETVTLSSSLKTIGHLTFYYCNLLRSIVIPEGIEEIGDKAFYLCYNLESITIPKSLKTIGLYNYSRPVCVFFECNKLKKVIISDLAAWCNIKFEDNTSNNNPLYYSHHLYVGDSEITDLVIPDGVTTISPIAFYGGSNFTSLTIPETVNTIGYCAFNDCSGLTSVSIPKSVSVIESAAFSCPNLTTVSLPSSIESIDKHTFGEAPLESIIVYNSGDKNYDSRNNCNAVINTETNDMVIACKNSTIPEGVEILSAEFPKGTSSISFPKSLKRFNASFRRCSSSLHRLKANWEDLSELTYYNLYEFWGLPRGISNECKLIVPKGTVELYQQTEPWKYIPNIVEKGSEEAKLSPGDANGDDKVNEADIVEVVNYIIGNPSGNFEQEGADANFDHKVNAADIVEIVKIIKANK